ncbi:type VI secretion system protein TssA [Aggregatibacter actinomycetemcomitans]|uniref:type VI secretion system protein TssA n=1 Tax=Aggregatibacter actinomycetemcomitans TaxID=714 RepID=UPI00197C3B36|nr:type VI secretion system protein TssA [Aggregatibacter actinomycetemcomitans]MBN6063477.1 type VI secretion system protein TssA [Aggregatibacter actinomycetemcomitans]MBN6082588.1 type VI secretion system protein TssA [Aggregatibacter actinomycetemcomitans]MBN6084550.1 type VI secretion system protein TssA [Aggregatibacter actinomycetemcomitans]
MKYQDILNDITGNGAPIGVPDEEGEVFSSIDEQVIKFGSLQHDSINWDLLINNSRQYLSVTCKDYKVLQYLGYALLHRDFKSNLLDFLSLFSKFNDKYLFIAYPKPSKDNTVNRFKAKSISLILERIENAAVNNPDIKFTNAEHNRAVVLIHELISQLSKYISNAEPVFSRLQRFVKERSNSEEKIPTISSQVLSTQVEKRTISSVQNNLNFPDANKVDLTNTRQLKQFYLQVADTTYLIEPGSTLGYISRRFGLWHGIAQLPEMSAQGNTMMQPVPIDKVSDYREQVVSSPSTDLLVRIEKTVTTSPYWIEGSYLSAKCCQALKFNDAAEAIRNSTKQFVDKFPMFHSAKFQNGEPFLNDDVLNWLSEATTNSSSKVSSVDDLKNNFYECYSSDGFVAVLKLIDEQLKLTIDARSRHYLQFEKVRFFLKENMLTIAINELSELIENCKKYTVKEWDSAFFTQLEQLKDKLLKDNK